MLSDKKDENLHALRAVSGGSGGSGGSSVSYDIELSFLPISRARLTPSATQLSSARSRQPARDTFMQPGNLPKRSPKHPDRQTSMSRVAALQPTKRANRTLCRPKIDNTDSS